MALECGGACRVRYRPVSFQFRLISKKEYNLDLDREASRGECQGKDYERFFLVRSGKEITVRTFVNVGPWYIRRVETEEVRSMVVEGFVNGYTFQNTGR